MYLNNKRVNQQKEPSTIKQGPLTGVNAMAARLGMHGGAPQEDRMIRDRRRSLDKAVLFSYQGAFVQKIPWDNFNSEDELEESPAVRALINPNKLKQDYDDKIISTGFENDFHCGDVFLWDNTNTHWIIYLQDLTELAYFRGDIRRCNYTIEWEDETGRHQTYCAVRGPVETRINYIQKHEISVDIPNHSINILMPSNEFTLKYFKRYTKFYLQDGTDEHKVCWRVEALDWISMPGILEINGVEYYANEHEDDIEEGIVGAKIAKTVDPNDSVINELIIGDTFIKPKINVVYKFIGEENHEWRIIDGNKLPINVKVNMDNDKQINICWNKSYSGQFVLCYGPYEKTIVVESLF